MSERDSLSSYYDGRASALEDVAEVFDEPAKGLRKDHAALARDLLIEIRKGALTARRMQQKYKSKE